MAAAKLIGDRYSFAESSDEDSFLGQGDGHSRQKRYRHTIANAQEFLAKAQESLTPDDFTEIIEIARNMTFEQLVEEILNL